MIRTTLLAMALLGGNMAVADTPATTPFTGKIQKLAVKAPLADPAYNMPIDLNSKLLCEATLKNGKTAYFISPKAAMMVYLHPDYFIKRKLLDDEIVTLYVRDYLSGEKIEANKAVYVFGSRLIGPHGDDLIPLSSMERARLFELKHGGTKILPFARIDQGLIRYLDM
jgi:hypothetical protein